MDIASLDLVALLRTIGVQADPAWDRARQEQEVIQHVQNALRLNKYMGPHAPSQKQMLFMLVPQLEVLFGGGSGGGKSEGSLKAALQYVDVSGYSAVIIRRTFQELSKADGLIPRSKVWLASYPEVKWNDDTHTHHFPNGATLAFGHCEHDGDELQYQGSAYQFVGFEELGQFPTDKPYRYLFSRLRRLKDSPVPIRMRATANPGGTGNAWIKARWGIGRDEQGRHLANPSPLTRLFIPALLDDNPGIDQEEYVRALKELDPVTYAQLRHGDWDVSITGDLFFPERIRVLSEPPTVGVIKRVRSWDKASTEGGGKFTVGILYSRVARGMYGVEYIVEDIVRGQWSSERRDSIIRQTAAREGRDVEVLIEQEPGSGGKQSAEITIQDLAGYRVRAIRPTGDKATRAWPVSSQVNAYNVGMLRGSWNGAFLDELRAAPNGVYMDQVDALAQAHNELALLIAVPLPMAQAYPALPSGARTD